MNRSAETLLKALSLAIKDNFPNLQLEFVEHNKETMLSYPVDLSFDSIKHFDTRRIVFYGKLTFYKGSRFGTIEYNFENKEFHHISYANKTRRLYKLIVHNKQDVDKLISFIESYIEECKNT